jgi:hypothetical protein
MVSGGERLTKQFTSGEGMSSDQSHDLVFGIGKASEIESVKVFYANGTTQQVASPPVGKLLLIQ